LRGELVGACRATDLTSALTRGAFGCVAAYNEPFQRHDDFALNERDAPNGAMQKGRAEADHLHGEDWSEDCTSGLKFREALPPDRKRRQGESGGESLSIEARMRKLCTWRAARSRRKCDLQGGVLGPSVRGLSTLLRAACEGCWIWELQESLAGNWRYGVVGSRCCARTGERKRRQRERHGRVINHDPNRLRQTEGSVTFGQSRREETATRQRKNCPESSAAETGFTGRTNKIPGIPYLPGNLASGSGLKESSYRALHRGHAFSVTLPACIAP